ncbi:M20/M25/M40 family metallo-hydrolase [Pseudomonas alliivorans]|nr:M20/M25/M40 family metallo-hydrolase [Pseudomonas alliivorans]
METASNLFDKLSAVIQLKTVTREFESGGGDGDFFNTIHRLFPTLCEHALIKQINGGSIVFIIRDELPGKRADLYIAHSDVVPTNDIAKWQRPPFSGDIDEGYIHGRGAIDNKGPLVAMLDAFDSLLLQGCRFNKRIIIAIGHDEEVGGEEGAAFVSTYLKECGYEIDNVVDEGTPIFTDFLSSETPVGLVSVAEKGFLNIKIKLLGRPGHASMPSEHTCIEKLSALICDLKKLNFHGVDSSVRDALFEATKRLPTTSRLELFDNFLVKNQSDTTLVVTMIAGGVKQNVIPDSAEAIVHMRIAEGNSCEKVLNVLTELVESYKGSYEIINSRDPSSVADIENDFYAALSRSITAHTNAIVLPFTMMASSDSIHYQSMTSNIYRIMPFKLRMEDLSMIHGYNEKISIKNMTLAKNLYLDFFTSIYSFK